MFTLMIVVCVHVADVSSPVCVIAKSRHDYATHELCDADGQKRYENMMRRAEEDGVVPANVYWKCQPSGEPA